jgi:DNA modification methylase
VLVFKKKANFLIDKVLQNNSLVSDGYERTNVWEIQPETKSWHSAPFPKKLAENIIRYYSYENETVFDCFAGSGSTLSACKELNRKFIGIELSPEYVKIANKRLSQETLNTNGGKFFSSQP